jgi:hypothetical protein
LKQLSLKNGVNTYNIGNASDIGNRNGEKQLEMAGNKADLEI